MGLNVRLLLFFVPVDPNFSRVFLRGNQLALLIDLIQELLPLDVILLLQRLLLYLQRVRFSLDLRQLILLFFKLALVRVEHLFFVKVGLFDRPVLPLQLLKRLIRLITDIISQVQVGFDGLVAGTQAHVIFCQAFRVHLEACMLAGDLIKLSLELLDLRPEGTNPGVSVLLDFIDTDDCPFELLGLLEQRFIHLLHLVALHHKLLLERRILLELELKVLFLAFEAVYQGALGFLNQHQLVHLLVLILDLQVLFFDGLLGLEQFLLDGLVRSHLLLNIDVERTDALILVADLRLVLDLERTQTDNFRFNLVILFLNGLAGQVQAVDVVESALVLRLQVAMQRVEPVQFRLELQTQLNLLLVRPNVLVNLFLEFYPKLHLVFKALANVAVRLLKLVKLKLQVLLVRIELPDIKIEALLHLGQGFLVFCVHLSELHLIAAAAAILEQDGVDFPD